MRNLAFVFTIAVLIVFSLSSVRADLREGLVLYINFDGEEVDDLSGTGNDGEVVGDPKWIDGPKPEFGKAVEFNGKGDHILVEDDDSLDVDEDDISISVWVNYVEGEQVTPYPKLVSNGMPDWGGGAPGFEITVKGNVNDDDHPLGLFYGSCGPGRQQISGRLEEIADGEWYHVVALKDDDEGRIYVDGELTGSGPLNPVDISNDKPLVIGGSGGLEAPLWFKGAVDDVAVYTRALTEDEIIDLSKAPISQVLSVEPGGKLPVTWGHIRRAY